MNIYSVCICYRDKVDPLKRNNVTTKFYKGLAEARKHSPVKVHYSRNTKAFYGFNDELEVWIEKE